MGLIKEVESSFGEQSTRSVPQPPLGRLLWFRNHFSTNINRFGTRLTLAAFALAAPFIAAPPARAEDHSGVKPESTTIIIDGNPVEISGVQTGGEELAVNQPGDSPDLEGQDGGGAASPDIAIAAELFNTTPQGRLQTEKLQEGEVGWKPREESAGQTDAFFNEVNTEVIIKYNQQLTARVGATPLWPDLNNRRGNQWYGILDTFTDPDNPTILIVVYKITQPRLKLNQAARDSIERQAAGAIGMGGLSLIIYGKSTLDETLTQDQLNYLGQKGTQLQNIRPLELVAPSAD